MRDGVRPKRQSYGQRVQRDGDVSHLKELSDNIPDLWADELRQEREKGERSFRVQHLGQDSTARRYAVEGPELSRDRTLEFGNDSSRRRSSPGTAQANLTTENAVAEATSKAQRVTAAATRERDRRGTCRDKRESLRVRPPDYDSARNVEEAGYRAWRRGSRRSDEESEKTGINHRKLYGARRWGAERVLLLKVPLNDKEVQLVRRLSTFWRLVRLPEWTANSGWSREGTQEIER